MSQLFLAFTAEAMDRSILTGAKDIFPLSSAPVICLNEHGEREVEAMQFGLVPNWLNSSENGNKFVRKYSTFNARSESVHDKRTFCKAFRTQRCLIPVTKFFEPPNNWFQLKKTPLFAMAGVWDRWNGSSGLNSFAILTTDANEMVAAHRTGRMRMPVILRSESEFSNWLNPNLVDLEPLRELFRSLNDSFMERSQAEEPERKATPLNKKKKTDEQRKLF